MGREEERLEPKDAAQKFTHPTMPMGSLTSTLLFRFPPNSEDHHLCQFRPPHRPHAFSLALQYTNFSRASDFFYFVNNLVGDLS